jgi:hypothetical protein
MAQIKEIISLFPENTPLIAKDIYARDCNNIPEVTFYKSLERMCQKNELKHLAKGTYYRPKHSRFGLIPISEEDVVAHYLQGGKGMLIGYRLYNEKGLTTQVGKNIEVLTQEVAEQKKKIDNVIINKTTMRLDKEVIETVEFLEVLQNYSRIEDFNNASFVEYADVFSKNCYNDVTVEYVLNHRSYKKSTIAFLRAILDRLGIKNNLSNYLSSLSKYQYPNMEELYESAQL